MGDSDYFLNQELAELEVAAIAFANQFIPDAKVRKEYIEETRKFALELREKVTKRQLSPQVAAMQAVSMRNTIMEAKRAKTSPLGLSIAKFMKKEGKTLAQLEEKYANELFKKEFSRLTIHERNQVWTKIVEQAGRPQVKASNGAKWMGRFGRGLFALTITIAVYNVATAEDKTRAFANEGAAISGGLAGGSALGTAGLACGPAAIACVPIGIFVGSVLGALGADFAFDRIWK